MRHVLPPGRGRGSSVGSLVCYLTGLSHVDPVANNLSLGRFLNRELVVGARHRPRLPARHPREADRPRHRALRPRARIARRELRDVPLARRDPRRRQGARPAVRRSRAAREALRRLERAARRRRARCCCPTRRRSSRSPRWRAFAELCTRDRRPAAPHLPAPGRDGHLVAAARRARARAAGGDGRAGRCASGTRTRAPTPAS